MLAYALGACSATAGVYIRRMQDLFTAEDRAALNATMASGSGSRYDAMLAERPEPGGAHRWGSRIGLLVLALIIGVVALAVIGVVGLVVLVLLAAAALVVSGRVAGWLHRRSLQGAAEAAVVADWATARGWRYVESISVSSATPLLRAGDERTTGWGVEGTLDDGTPFSAGFYQYTEERTVTDTDSEGRTTTRTERTDYPFAVAHLAAPLPDLTALSLTDGGWGFLAKIEGAVSNLRPVELESAEFNDAYRLMVDDACDDHTVRLRFTPAVQVAFIERGSGAARVEAEGGVLLVARAGRPDHGDFGALLDLLGDAIWLRAVLTDDPPGRLPDVAALRTVLLGASA